jgi:hypothetical protein
MQIKSKDGRLGHNIDLQSLYLGPLGRGQRFGRDMQLNIAQRIRLACQTITLPDFLSREGSLFLKSRFCDLPCDHLYFTTLTIADAPADTDNIYCDERSRVMSDH